MTAREYLSQARMIDARINAKLEQVARMRAMLTGGVRAITGMPRGGGHDWTDVADKVVTLEAEINAEINRMVDTRREIGAAIMRVPDADARLLMEMRYLAGYSWGRVAKEMHCDRTTVWRIHRKAIVKLCAQEDVATRCNIDV